MASLGYDVWGVIAGVLGTLGLLPVLCQILRSQLPSAKFQVLQDIFVETEELFHTVTEEGLLRDTDYVSQTRKHLYLMHSQVEDLRAAIHSATSFWAEFVEMVNGLSRKISVLCHEIKIVRAKISETSSEERRRLLSTGTESEDTVAGPSLQPPRHRVNAALVPMRPLENSQRHVASLPPSGVTCDLSGTSCVSHRSESPRTRPGIWRFVIRYLSSAAYQLRAMQMTAPPHNYRSSCSSDLNGPHDSADIIFDDVSDTRSAEHRLIMPHHSNTASHLEGACYHPSVAVENVSSVACFPAKSSYLSHNRRSSSILHSSRRFKVMRVGHVRSVASLQRAFRSANRNLIAGGHHPVLTEMVRSMARLSVQPLCPNLQKSSIKKRIPSDRPRSPSMESLNCILDVNEDWEDCE